MIGTLASCAALSAGSRPSELSGEMIRAFAPWAIMLWMSAISLLRSDCALVVIRLMPRFAASALIDSVSVIRKGLASFSDWAKPTVMVPRSSFGTPPLYFSAVQVSPALAVAWTCCAAALPAGFVLVLSAPFEQPLTESRSAAAMATPPVLPSRLELYIGEISLHWAEPNCRDVKDIDGKDPDASGSVPLPVKPCDAR